VDTQANIDPRRFSHPDITADGEARASVSFRTLDMLWLNTGTLCNVACDHCYIESSPVNDRLAYLQVAEAIVFLDEIQALKLETREIGLTGGEPFMNPDIIAITEEALSRGFAVLVLTNAMKPMARHQQELTRLVQAYGDKLTLRVSLDHFEASLHEQERGPNSWQPAIEGLHFLCDIGANVDIAGRSLTDAPEADIRAGYQKAMVQNGIAIDAHDPRRLTLFPEMDASQQATEITTACWKTLDVRPEDQMCASARMVVKRKGADKPVVLACTLLPYDHQFEMGHTLEESFSPVKLNHPHCSQFCILGGASCS
jgi:organic radical activating enzyme